MVLKKNDITEIFTRRHVKKQTILTWKGFRKIKLLDKRAVLRDIWNAFCREFDEQRQFLEEEVANMRQQIQAEKEKSGAHSSVSVSGHFLEELRGLFKDLESELEGSQTHPLNGKSEVLERIKCALDQGFDEQFQIVDRMEQDSLEHMNKLRRRLERMAKDLQMSEEEVARLRESLAAAYDGGTPSAYKAVQGLSIDEEGYQKKCDLLHLLFEQNLDMRKNVTS